MAIILAIKSLTFQPCGGTICNHIESRLQPLVELNDGKYDDMSDEKFYEALKDIFDKYLNDEDE